ncbi:MAG: hypothetical protein R3185_05490, partial [Candidatus Thermoplasmatota archaeon]|nr:hypothetical protein [Candidatus Thermoplasmatota archaeon]
MAREALLIAVLLLTPAFVGCIGGDADQALDPASQPDAPADLPQLAYESVGEDRVIIHRDAHGVPHVYADTMDDLY